MVNIQQIKVEMARKKKKQSTTEKKPTDKGQSTEVKKPSVAREAKPDNQQSTGAPSWLKWSSFFAFLVFAAILYGQATSYGYVLDDKLVYIENDFAKEGMSGIKKILTTESFTGYFKEQKQLVQGSRYRPLSLITFNLEHTIFGTSSFVSHLINILLYALTAWLIFIGLLRLLSQVHYENVGLVTVAILTATLYVAHPLHVEAIANVKGRDEVLSLLFSMLSMWSALKYVDARKKALPFLVLTVVTFLLGLLAKENTLTFMAIIPFGIYLFRKGEDVNKKLLITTLALLITSVAYLILRYSVIGFLINDAPSNDIMNNSFAGLTGTEKYATIFYTLFEYLKLNIFPYPLTHDYYPYHIPISGFGDLKVILALLLHFLLIAVMFYFWRKDRVVSFAIGYYFATMSIVSNLVISIGTFMNERFAFAASLASCLLIVHLILKFLPNKSIAKGIIGVIILAYATLSFLRVPAWESELTLNTAAIKVSKNSARSNSFMATALFNEFKQTTDRTQKKALLDQAQPYAQKSVEIYPNYYNGNLMRAGIAGELHKMDGDLDKLLAEFHAIMMHRPDVGFLTEYLDYIGPRSDQNKILTFYKRSVNMMMDRQQRYDWSVKFLNSAMKLDQNDPEIRSLMRKAYTGLGQLENANQYR